MKKTKLIGLASVLLALGVMAGCGKKGGDDGKKDDPVCAHEYEFKSIDDAKHQEVCKLCGEVKANSAKNHSFSKDAAKVADNKAATCTEAGWEWQICKCGATKKKDINALNHSFTKVKSTTATCTEAGLNTMECSRCGVESPDKVEQAALDHNWVADTSYTDGLAASCTGAGTAREKCDRPGCTETKIVETAALGHDYNDVAGTPANGFATVTTGTCKRTGCEGKRIYWDANELTEECKNDKRLAKAAVEDDPTTEDVDETAAAVYEPNYVEEGDGIRFWGRPIHNACVLDEVTGKPSSQSAAAPVYDATITGSYFEYKINLANAMDSVKLVADMAPTRDLGTGELYKATSGDWTPGLRDSVDDKYDVRYALFIDNEEVAIDGANSYPCPGSDRAWFTFPTAALNLAAGPHTIKLCMAGGYLSTYYAFGFEKVVAAAHEHDYTKNTTLSKDATCEEDGRFYGVCQCGLIKDEVLPKLGHNLVDDPKDTDYAATCCYDGTAHKKCDRAGCNHEEDVVLPALGHDFANDGEAIVESGFATIQPQKCSRDNVERYVIAGNDVNAATKTAKVITPADPDNNVEEVTQANYVENTDGSVKFNNIPIHNASGGSSRPTEDTYPSLYSAGEEGSFIAYTFKTGVLEDVKIVMDIKPNQYLGNSRKMFSNDLASDWTPGLKKIGDGDEATYEAYQERYVFELDGQYLELDLDSDYNEIAGSTRRWFTVPLKNTLNFTAGEHTVKIRMGGGYVCDIYNVGVQTQDPENTHQGGGNENPPVHEHAWANPVTTDAVANVNVASTKETCECGDAKITMSAVDMDGKITAEGGKLPKGTSGKYDGTAIARYVFNSDAALEGKFYALGGVDNAGNEKLGFHNGKANGDKQLLADGATNTVFTINGKSIVVSDKLYSEGGIGENKVLASGLDAAGLATAIENKEAGLIEIGDAVVKEGLNTFTMAATDSYGIRYYKIVFIGKVHTHSFVSTPVAAVEGGVTAYADDVCACGAKRISMKAPDGKLLGGSENKESDGVLLKLGSKGDKQVEYKFNVAAAGKAHLVVEACMDSFGTAGQGNTKKTFYSGSNPYEEKDHSNIEFRVNDNLVDLSGYKTTAYDTIFPTENPVKTGYSGLATIDLGEIDVAEGLNTLNVKRIDSFNIIMKNIYIVF